MKNFLTYIFFLLAFGFSIFETTAQSVTTDTTGIFLVNQIGYLPKGSKIALIKSKADQFNIVDNRSKKIVFTGKTGIPQYWKYSGDTVREADFSSFTKPGKYMIDFPGNSTCSYDFEIKENVYREVAKASIKAFYYNRCSFAIAKEFGGKWARPSGHPDTAVIVHESAASKERPAGTIISSPGGWYDAGDYNKYIVNSGITVYTLLLFYQMYPEYCNALNTNIPESNNDIPDVVDEILYNLKWMLTMQDPYDGGVYHKLTNKVFDGIVMPDKAVAPRYVVMKCTSAALDFAAVTAMASRLFENSKNAELAALSGTCREAAHKAMAWAKANPAIYFKQPSEFRTGG
jgi:endoglucanase